MINKEGIQVVNLSNDLVISKARYQEIMQELYEMVEEVESWENDDELIFEGTEEILLEESGLQVITKKEFSKVMEVLEECVDSLKACRADDPFGDEEYNFKYKIIDNAEMLIKWHAD